MVMDDDMCEGCDFVLVVSCSICLFGLFVDVGGLCMLIEFVGDLGFVKLFMVNLCLVFEVGGMIECMV